MSRRYHSNLLGDTHQVVLEGPEFHHFSHVARIQAGESVTLFDGLGYEADGVVQKVLKREAWIELGAKRFAPGILPLRVTLATALPKGDREMFLVEKITELGVGELVPLSTKRSVVHPRETGTRLGRYALEACKQSGRNLLPQIAELTPLAEFLTRCDHRHRWILHPAEPSSASCAPGFLPEKLEIGTSLALAIGPEGGFGDEELSQAREAGWKCWSIAGNILRIETAAVYCAALIRGQFSDEPTSSPSR